MRKTAKFFIIPIIIFSGLFLFNNINAQTDEEETGIIVSPPYLVKDFETIKTFSQNFSVINQRTSAEYIVVKSREVGVDENGNYFVPEGYDQNDPSSFEQKGWIEISPKEFFLEKG